MKKKWPVLLILAAAVLSLWMPVMNIHVHAQLGEETAALFPKTISLWDVMTRGSSVLPVDQVPALKVINPGSSWFLCGMILLLLSGVISFLQKKGAGQLAIITAAAAAACLGTGVLQLQNLDGSVLFSVLLSMQFWAFVPLVAALALIVFNLVKLKGAPALLRDDRKLRLLSGALACAALVSLLLPVAVFSVPDTFTANPSDAAAINGSCGEVTVMLGNEKSLSAIGSEKGLFTDILTGDLAELEPYSGDANNIRGVFQIKNSTTAANVPMLGAAVLLLLGAVLSFVPRVDRWFPLAMISLAAVLLATSVPGVMGVGEEDMFGSASRQLLHLGVGSITVVPLLTALLSVFSATAAVLGVRCANEPYFVNPLPEGVRIRFTAACMVILSIACLLLPVYTVSFTKAGKSKVQSEVVISGWDAVTFRAAEKLADPVDSKGKAVYKEDAEEYPVSQINSATASQAHLISWLTIGALVLTLAALALLLMKRSAKMIIILLLAGLVLRLITWGVAAMQLPRAVATGSGTLYLYASMVLMVFSAFFTNFAHLNELPKKYKLFLMMLPFLLAVFLFSYLPLYGWSYAFFNYKFGLPMDQQEFVGFKWFTEMFTNQANRENIIRVLKNTFGMSGLNLLTSWMPMVFAIFLNEITRTRFKKFVQIFTTLPNFISWALVFSFAMCMFAADTGIYSKFMMAVGLNDPNNPTVWLNSPDHIWIKMWGWSTWKGLGWGAIMYLAAISGIDQELYEAADVDGANRWHKMRYITLPGLLPTFFVLLMLSISNILNNGMEQYLVFQNPMNRQTIEVLDLYVYNITIASGGTALYSYATAIGILKTLVSVTLLFTANFASKKLRGESIM